MIVRKVLKGFTINRETDEPEEPTWTLETYKINPVLHVLGKIAMWIEELVIDAEMKATYSDISEQTAYQIDPGWKKYEKERCLTKRRSSQSRSRDRRQLI